MPRISYEAASDIEGDAASHSISPRSQLILLSQSILPHLPDHWFHEDGTALSPADRQQIEDWASSAEHELITDTAGGTDLVKAPFWDTSTDVDDEEATETQPWYGYVDDPELPREELTFFESAAVWVFTGFLAVSATPAAAILFNTIAPSFVLAMRGDDFGEVIRILIDGEEQARVDTTGLAGDVVNVPVYGNPDNATHEVMLIKVS